MGFDVYRGARVLVTGHTGFKGSWLCEWLLSLGAEVHGFALEPSTRPSLFRRLKLARRLPSHVTGDVRDLASLTAAVTAARPEFVFHLAAQPLVRESYRRPVETFATNVMGTVNLLEAVRRANLPRCAVVCVTTDKVYENDESGRAFPETAPLGGNDPYSASKGACEVAIASYRRSFFSAPDSPVRVASARAGNVVGGGDWARDRLVPDAMRALETGRPLRVRNMASTRPWQHVLEPLAGYLTLGARLSGDAAFAQAFNFGPRLGAVKTVGELVQEIARVAGGLAVVDGSDPDAPHEARRLTLDSAKAARLLGWEQRWGFARTVRETCDWYRGVARGESARALCRRQIAAYSRTGLG